MTNLVDIEYVQTGKATNTAALSMREMQAMVHDQRRFRRIPTPHGTASNP